MKKMLICCGVLCMTLLLFCGTAFAATVTVTPGSDSSVTVTPDAANQVFTVKKESGVTAKQLYLVMIQKGDATAMPNSDNLYYLNVKEADSTGVSVDAYPKDLTDAGKYTGDYAVFLSDYSGNNNGARKQVATITVSEGSTPGIGTDPTPGDVLYGDVNSDKAVDDLDEMVLARYNAGWDDYGPGMKYNVNMVNANVNMDKGVDDLDEMILSRHNAGWDGYDLPYKK